MSGKVPYLETYNEVMHDLLADDSGASSSLTVVKNKNVTDGKGLEKGVAERSRFSGRQGGRHGHAH